MKVGRWLFVSIMMFFVICVSQGYYNILRSTYYGQSYPHDTFLSDPTGRFDDFSEVYLWGSLTLHGGNPYTDRYLNNFHFPARLAGLEESYRPNLRQAPPSRSGYIPLANLIAAGFATWPAATALLLFMVIVCDGCLAALMFQAQAMAWKDSLFFLAAVAPIVFLSYPFIFMLDRGNMEGLLLVASWFFLLLYKEKKPLAWLILAVAANIKPQMAALGILPLLAQDYRFLAKTAGGGLLIFLGSLMILPGPLQASWLGMKAGVGWSLAHLADRETIENELRFTHTLFSLIAAGACHIGHKEWLLPLVKPVKALSLMAGLSALGISWRRRQDTPFEFQALVAVGIMLFLPPFSADYTLVHLLPILCLLIGKALTTEPEATRRQKIAICLILLVLAPKQFFIGTTSFPYGLSFINGLALAGLLSLGATS